MSDRKRINISVDSETYDRLTQLKEAYGFKNLCELVVAFSHILIDRMETPAKRKYDMPEDDGQYIDSMFNDLAGVEAESDSSVIVNGRRIHNHNK